jgi:hypothetical protein
MMHLLGVKAKQNRKDEPLIHGGKGKENQN